MHEFMVCRSCNVCRVSIWTAERHSRQSYCCCDFIGVGQYSRLVKDTDNARPILCMHARQASRVCPRAKCCVNVQLHGIVCSVIMA